MIKKKPYYPSKGSKVLPSKEGILRKEERKMRKEKMVTRTVESVECEVMCLNVTTAEVSINTYEISKALIGNKPTIDALKKAYETETFKLVAIQSEKEIEQLYGMTESDFMKYSKKLPPRGLKENDEN